MNDFDQRWRTLAKQAGGLLDEALPELPFGFATRVIARFRDSPVESWDDVLSALGLRAVLITAGVCLIAAGLAFSEWYEFRMQRPAVERTLTGELSWP